jgi:hypothetical protein
MIRSGACVSARVDPRDRMTNGDLSLDRTCLGIQTAIKPETRASRIAEFVAMLQRREALHP